MRKKMGLSVNSSWTWYYLCNSSFFEEDWPWANIRAHLLICEMAATAWLAERRRVRTQDPNQWTPGHQSGMCTLNGCATGPVPYEYKFRTFRGKGGNMFMNRGINEYGLEKHALLRIWYWCEIWHIFVTSHRTLLWQCLKFALVYVYYTLIKKKLNSFLVKTFISPQGGDRCVQMFLHREKIR